MGTDPHGHTHQVVSHDPQQVVNLEYSQIPNTDSLISITYIPYHYGQDRISETPNQWRFQYVQS